MPSTPPRTPIKDPERCPHCNGTSLIRKGSRRKKLESLPIFRCKGCGRSFTPGPLSVRNKTYPVGEILEALTLYNRGYSFAETSRKLSSRFGHAISPSTISRWYEQHPQLTSYRRLRAGGLRQFPPAKLVRTIKLYHRQIYKFAYHRAKLAAVAAGTIDDRRAGDTRFAALAQFIEDVPDICPHGLFSAEQAARSSRLADGFIAADRQERLLVIERQNTATETAALVLPAVGSNHERHAKLQRFMLANDSTTIAVEVPIWLDEAAIAALEAEYGITLLPKVPVEPRRPGSGHQPRTITGHIDFLQVRNGAVHILDYKPDARTSRPIAQLTVYALALTRLVPGLKLFDIKCAWFNQAVYNEFFPRKLMPR